MATKYRHSAGFGRRMEYWLIGQMLREGLDVYVPLVDDIGVDAVIRKADNNFIEVQIKARSHEVKFTSAALFAGIDHPLPRQNYYFVFRSERLNTMWIMSSEELMAEASQIKNGRNKGLRAIWLNGTKINEATGKREEYQRERYKKFIANDFSRFKDAGAIVATPAPVNEGPEIGVSSRQKLMG
jgi:hypothetical protein